MRKKKVEQSVKETPRNPAERYHVLNDQGKVVGKFRTPLGADLFIGNTRHTLNSTTVLDSWEEVTA